MTRIVNDDNIRTLRDEAQAHGDAKMAAKCERALGGSVRARNEIEKYLRGMRFEQTMTKMREAAHGVAK